MTESDWKYTIDYLDSVGEDLTNDMIDVLKRNNKWASGALVNSINYDINIQNEKFNLVIEYAGHGKYVIDGRRPGKFPPISAIKNWVLNKRISNPLMTIDQLSFVIARGIAKKGIRPLNFLAPYEKLMASQQFEKNLKDNLIKDIEIQISKGIKQNEIKI